jgi:hypothetical protein
MNNYRAVTKVRDFLVKRRKSLIIYWILLSCVVIVLDYLTGPFIYFPIFFLFPIVLTTWFNGLRWGLVFACFLPLFRIFFPFVWPVPWSIVEVLVNVVIRIVFFSFVVVLVDREVKRRVLLEEVKVLRGILPICSFCKKIRTKHNSWIPLEEYLDQYSEAELSHGFCPECVEKHYGVELSSKK